MQKDIDINRKLNAVSNIYACIYDWIISENADYEKRVHKEADAFLDRFSTGKSLHDKYAAAYEQAKKDIQLVEHTFSVIENSMELNHPLTLDVYTSLLTFLYRDVQQEIFLYNTIYNKLLFEEKFILLYESLKDKFLINHLELLTYLDRSTTYKYLENNFKTIEAPIPDLAKNAEVVLFIDLLSEQKEWERRFNSFLKEQFTPALIKVRSKIHDILNSMLLMPSEDDEKLCIWRLLPYIQKVRLRI